MLKSRRLAVLASAGGLLLVSAAPALGAPLSPSAVVTPGAVTIEETTATTASVVVATYNLRHALSVNAVVGDLKALADTGVDVMGLQEMGGRDREAAVAEQLACSSCQFDVYMPNEAGQRATPILYRRSMFSLLSAGTQKISNATYVGPSGAGPSTVAAKYLNYVLLDHRVTGQDIYVINSHTVASVEVGGEPNYNHPERLRLYRKHMDRLSAMINEFKATGAAVFTTGDFNVNYRLDSVVRHWRFPYYNMSQLGVFASYKFLGMPEYGTHVRKASNDTRLIDYVSSLTHAAVVPKEQTVLKGYSSDHRPVRVRYAITQ